jgi:hypothetical protein
MAKKKAPEEENELYRKQCKSSLKCSIERQWKVINDANIEFCPQCYQTFNFEMIVVDKPKKVKSEKNTQVAEQVAAPEVAPVQETAPVPVQEMEMVATPVIPISAAVETPAVENTVKAEADEMKKVFSDIDGMLDQINAPETAPAEVVEQIAIPVPAPIAATIPVPPAIIPGAIPAAIQEAVIVESNSVFPIIDFSVKSTTEISLVCETATRERFIVHATTGADKTEMIRQYPQLVIGRGAIIRHKGFDQRGVPAEGSFINLAAPQA